MKTILLLFMSIFLSGCLMTHKQIGTKKKKVLKKETVVSLKSNPPLPSSVSAEIQASLRELRGEVESQGKREEDRIIELEKGLLELIQGLDLRLVALEKQIKKIKVASNNPKAFFTEAESLFQQKKWKPAIVQYEKYRAKNKKGEFYHKATFQIGLCFQKLNLNKESKVFFKEVVQSFPKSAEAKKAREILKQKI